MQLSNENIAQAVKDIQNFFEQAEVSQRDRMKINLTVEEALLRWQEHFGAEKDFQLKMSDRFGAPKVLIRIKGAAYNPLVTDDATAIFSAKVMQNLLMYEGADTNYAYKDGYNEITTFSTRERKPFKLPGGSITVAIVLAIAASLVVEELPQGAQDFIVDSLALPILNTLMSLIIAVTVPTVFVSIVSSVCMMEDITTLSNIGFKVIRRFMGLMLAVVLVSMSVCMVLFPVVSLDGTTKLIGEEIIQMFLSVVPANLFAPFVEGNILQVVMIAFLTSVCIVILGQHADTLKTGINGLKGLFFKMTEIVLKIIPLTIFLSIFKAVMTTSLANLLSVWKIVVVSYITYIGIGIFMLAYLKLKYRLNIRDFFRKNSSVFIISLTMLSGTASMMVNFDVCKKEMKIDPHLCDFWIPLSHTLFSPGTVNTLVTCAFMGAAFSHETITISELLIIAFLAIQLSIVSPKVYGGAIATFTIMLTQLGFSTDVIGMLMVADVFTINLSSLFGMLARNCELYDLSHQVKFSAA